LRYICFTGEDYLLSIFKLCNHKQPLLLRIPRSAVRGTHGTSPPGTSFGRSTFRPRSAVRGALGTSSDITSSVGRSRSSRHFFGHYVLSRPFAELSALLRTLRPQSLCCACTLRGTALRLFPLPAGRQACGKTIIILYPPYSYYSTTII